MHVADKLGQVSYIFLQRFVCNYHNVQLIVHIQQEVSWVEDKLQEVVEIIPDLAGKVDTMKADIVMQFVSDTQVSLLKKVELADIGRPAPEHKFQLICTCIAAGSHTEGNGCARVVA